MRTLSKLIASAAVVASATALAVVPALAAPASVHGVLKDPTKTPAEGDVVGTGSDTIQDIYNQLSFDYNRTHATGARLWSWNATNPVTGAMHDMITPKSGCAQVQRPDGSSEGITALEANAQTADKTHFCFDFARSSRPRATTDPPKAPGGIVFVALAKDAVAWAANSTTNAPANLTTAQLTEIYTCTVPAVGGNPPNNWADLGGKAGTINPQLPQSGSGTRKFFQTAINVPNPGSCVGQTAQENEGINPALAGPNTIFPFSIGKYIAQVFHSAKCTNKTCTGSPPCKPTGSQNRFGCDEHGSMVLHQINGTKPTVGSGTSTTINPSFSPNFIRLVFEVVRFASTADNIPAYLEPFVGHSGWACTNATAKTDIRNYGFLSLGSACGATS